MGGPVPRIALDVLRDRIAEGIKESAKSYDVPAVCVRVGIQKRVKEGDTDEAFRSRRVYVKSRLMERDQPALLVIANAVLKEFDVPSLAEAVQVAIPLPSSLIAIPMDSFFSEQSDCQL